MAVKVVEYDDEDHEDLEIEIGILQRASHSNIVAYCGTYLKFGKVWVSGSKKSFFFFFFFLFFFFSFEMNFPFWED